MAHKPHPLDEKHTQRDLMCRDAALKRKRCPEGTLLRSKAQSCAALSVAGLHWPGAWPHFQTSIGRTGKIGNCAEPQAVA
jgi:hypothetical protein